MVKNNILVYGCGRTGKAIAQELRNENISTYRGNSLEGCNQLDDLSGKTFDYLVVTLAENGPDFSAPTTWDMRDAELEETLPAIYNLGGIIHNNPSPASKVIMVSNPSDALAKYFEDYFDIPTIPFGLYLDSLRYSSIAGKIVDAYGYHGASVPLLRETTREPYETLIKSAEEKLASQVRTGGIPYGFIGKAFQEWFYSRETPSKAPVLNSIERYLVSEKGTLFQKQYERVRNFHRKREAC